MDRLKLWLIPTYACAGFLVAALIAPSSRWEVLTQLDVLAGRWKYLGGWVTGTFPNMPFVRPKERDLEDLTPPATQPARFWWMVTPPQGAVDTDEYRNRFDEMERFCQAEADPRYWAQLVREGGFHEQILFKDPGEIPFQRSVERHTQAILRTACETGASLDPGNAFFPAMLSGLLTRLGDPSAARQALLDASKCPRYDAYTSFEPEQRIKYLQDRYGDRGNLPKAWPLTETMLPQLNVLGSIGRYYSEQKDPQAHLALVRLANLEMTQDPIGISVIVGRGVMSRALAEKLPREHYSAPDLTAQQVRQALFKLESETGEKLDVERIVSLYQTIDPNKFDFYGTTFNGIDLVLTLRPAWSGASLLAILLIPVCLGFVFLKVAGERFGAACPHLVWLVTLATEHLFGARAGPAPAFGLAALFFVPALFPTQRRWTDVAGLAVAVLAFAGAIFAWNNAPLAVIALMFTLSLVSERCLPKIPLALTLGGVVVACVLGAASWVSIAVRLDLGSAIFFGSLATLGALAAVPARKPVNWLPLAGVACLILGAFYAVTFARDLDANRQLAVVCQKLLKDGDDLRNSAGALER